ncbi:hypothetical protein QYE76_005477 [Lolium multiflorum]|uniref:F-box domain-containing protein n=1 Tax=Lolium multiflorum TaxID=4521 RepID=A0AAD8RUI8_LOLMU|nr:hypothetical protein QYE76_005477 [Lolium multiflorum]
MAPSPSREKRPTPADTVDILLTLPPQMLDEILSRLPIRDIVRTSALSRSWRHRWKALPSIGLTWPAQHVVAREAVKAVLHCYPGRIQRFSALVGKGSARSLGVWFRKLASCGIEYLYLDGAYIFPLHVSVFALASLTSLELCECRVPGLPNGFMGFPNLTKLKLFMVELPAGGEYHLQDIIAKSPLIEDLYLGDARTLSDTMNLWVIQAPNLRHLTLASSDDYGWILGDFPLLEYALIDLGKYLSGRDFGTLLGKLCHAKMLEIYTCHSIPIMVGSDQKQIVEANGDFQNKQWSESMFANLQEVQIKDIGFYSNEMSFIELVLSKARLLRRLSIRLDVECLIPKEEVLDVLLKYSKASPNVEVGLEDIDDDMDMGIETDLEESTDDDS